MNFSCVKSVFDFCRISQARTVFERLYALVYPGLFGEGLLTTCGREGETGKDKR